MKVAKFLVAALTAALTAAQTALPLSSKAHAWTVIVLAALGAASVYAVPNRAQ